MGSTEQQTSRSRGHNVKHPRALRCCTEHDPFRRPLPRAEIPVGRRGLGGVGHPQRGVSDRVRSHPLAGLPDVAPHRARSSTQALILDPHGHIEYDLHIVDDGESTWLIVDGATVDNLVTYLNSMRFMADVAVADVSAAHHVVWVPRREEHDGHPTWLIPLEFAGLGSTPSGRTGAARLTNTFPPDRTAWSAPK